MSASDKKTVPAIGFLTVVEHAEHGLFGGYLVLNAGGRPMEFHCTAPLKSNRAQEILYGPTLKPFLYGEQIGQTLIEKGRVEPLFVCTDVEHVLAAREFVKPPVVLVLSGAATAAMTARLKTFALDQLRAAVALEHKSDEAAIVAGWDAHARNLDLMEPFSRIRDAMEEAQRTARPAA